MKTKNFNLLQISPNQSSKETILNENNINLDSLIRCRANKFITILPQNANDGDVFIISNNPSGDIMSQKNQICIYHANYGYKFIEPKEGMLFFILENKMDYIFTKDSWVEMLTVLDDTSLNSTSKTWSIDKIKSYFATKVDMVNSTADWNAVSGNAQILNKPAIFNGDYNALTNKPVIPVVTDASETINGLMSASDKAKLNTLYTGNDYELQRLLTLIRSSGLSKKIQSFDTMIQGQVRRIIVFSASYNLALNDAIKFGGTDISIAYEYTITAIRAESGTLVNFASGVPSTNLILNYPTINGINNIDIFPGGNLSGYSITPPFNTTTKVFTAPALKTYWIQWSIILNSTTSKAIIYKNGIPLVTISYDGTYI